MRMPKEKVKWIEYLLEKHGEDYEVIHCLLSAMDCDSKMQYIDCILAIVSSYMQALEVMYFFELIGHGHGQKESLPRNCSPAKTEN